MVVALFSASFVLTGLPSPAPAQAAASVAGEVYATTPTKVLDTRTGLGAPKAALGAGRTLLLTLAGKGGIPASGAASAVLQLTTLSTTASTSLTVWPTGAVRPATPNIAVTVGRTTTVAITSKLGSAGRVSIFNAAGTVQLADHTEAWATTGATAAAGSRLAPLAPARVLDTRAGLGAPRAALGAGRTLVFAVAGRGGVPATGAAAVGLNLTALSVTTRTSLVTALASAAGSVSYAYDARQLVSSRILAAGSTRALTHDDDGRLTGDGPFTLTRNGPGGLTSNITDGTSSQDLSYDTAGRPAGRSVSVSGAAVYTGSLTYDSAGRVATRTDGASTSAYTYDPDGRLTGVSQAAPPSPLTPTTRGATASARAIRPRSPSPPTTARTASSTAPAPATPMTRSDGALAAPRAV